ncbi:hypothetical protein NE865_00003 [Phthorimaea operculella]|nr:hypothetical protein NE865_00003 [Phthorimaea operculella]
MRYIGCRAGANADDENIPNNLQTDDSIKNVSTKLATSRGQTSEWFREWDFNNIMDRSSPDATENDTPSTERYPFSAEDDDDVSKCYDYGEPAHYQHLRIDFTPIEGVDDEEELFEKCIGFLDFVNSRPEIKEILDMTDEMFKPSKENASSTSSATSSASNRHEEKSSEKPMFKTAVQWSDNLPLGYVARMPLEQCPDNPPLYKHSSDKSSESSGPSRRSWGKPKKERVVPRTYDDKKTKKLNAEMDDFDQKHPRSFEPPGYIAKSLIKAEMTRLPPVSCTAPGLYPD